MHTYSLVVRAALLCTVSACGRFGFASTEILDESGPSTAPTDMDDAGLTLPPVDFEDLPPEMDAGSDVSDPSDASTGQDASSADAGSAENLLGCDPPPPGSVWCATFDGELPTQSYVDAYRGAVDLTTANVYRGSGALEAHAYRSRGYAALSADLTGYQGPTLHARAHFFVSSGVVVDDFTILHIGHWNDPLGGTDLDLTNDQLETFSYADGQVVRSNVAVPRDRWFCLQMEVSLAEVAGSVRVVLDGQEILLGTDLVTLPPEGVTDVAMGIPWTGGNQPELSLFVDEVAVGASPIDCL